MERQEIPIRFADLRRLTTAVPAYLATLASEPIVPPLRAELEETFGLAGLDTEEVILSFSETYRVNYADFDFTGLISPEGLDLRDTLWFFPLAAYFLTGWLLKTVGGLLCWPFASEVAQRIWSWQVPAFWRAAHAQPKALTIGDFVASAAVGQFVRREHVRFRLVA